MSKKEYHRGIIRDNEDPEKRGRLIVECSTIVCGEALGDWIDPQFHFIDSSAKAGAFWVPNIGSDVTVEIESEPDSEATGLEPRWRCEVYPQDSVPDEFTENYPNRRGWKTKAGHLLYFDDTDDSNEFLYQHPTGTKIYINNDGDIQLVTKDGSRINILNSGNIELYPTGSNSVLIGGGANQQLVLGNLLLSYIDSLVNFINSHVHGAGTYTTPSGPVTLLSAIPTALMSQITTAVLSDNHKVK